MVQQFSVLNNQYFLHETIGSGGFAKVKLATHLLTGDKVAIKIMDKQSLGDDLPRIDTEIKALKDLCHQNICRLFQVIEDDEKLFLVLEYCSGGELFDYIVKKDRLPEPEARHFFRQILSAVAFVHSKGYAHRDLKPENLLLTNDLQLKLIDFGLCANPQRDSKRFLDTCCGSPAYAAPELIAGNAYDGKEVDIWSMGVLLYALLCGFLPFEDENLPKMYLKIQSGKYNEPHWLSDSSRAILKAMLRPDPVDRIKIDKLLCHPWVVRDYTQPLKFQSTFNRQVDRDCAIELASHLGLTYDEAVNKISEWKYDSLTVTYFILLNRKRKGQPVVLPPSARSFTTANTLSGTNVKLLKSPTLHASLETDLNKFDYSDFANDVNGRSDIKHSYRKAMNFLSIENTTPCAQKIRTHSTFKSRAYDKENIGSYVDYQMTPINAKRLTVNCYNIKRDTVKICEKDAADSSPIVLTEEAKQRKSINAAVQTTTDDVVRRETPARSTDRLATKSCDFDASMSTNEKTSDDSRTPRSLRKDDVGSATAKKLSRRVFNSVERRVDRVINLLTPKRYRSNYDKDAQPAVIGQMVTNVVNISTTTCANPERVRDELLKVFEAKGISCKQKGWVIRGEAKDAQGRKNLTLELEVVRIERLNMVGVKRKRLNGDSFMYKRVCEDVLNLASL